MHVDLSKLLTNKIDILNLCDSVNIPVSFLEDSLIDGLKNTNIDGTIILDEELNLVLDAELSGIMVLKDDVTLEPVEYSFETKIEEILKKNENILDITDILWQNILVEIPSKVRSTDEDIELSGDGWRVISEKKFFEERNKSNNPFSNLGELLKTKEEK